MMQMRCQNVYPVVLRYCAMANRVLGRRLGYAVALGLAVNSGNVAGAG